MSLADQLWCPTSVQVTVHQARGLRIKGKSGTNDAYAVMQVGKEKFQTSVVEKSVAPVWKEEAAFDLPQLQQGGGGGGGGGGGAERSTLHVHVLHRALVGPDKLLGQAVINLRQLSEDKSRNKTEWFKLLDKTGKADKDRGEVLVDIQFMRNNMTASMFDLSAAGKSRSRLGKFKDKVRGKKKESDTASTVVPLFSQVLTDSEEEGNGDAEVSADKDKKKKKHKMKSLFSPKSNLQKNMSQSMSVLPGKNSSLSGSQSSGLNVDPSEGKKKFKFLIHKRSGSSDSKDSSSGHQKHGTAEQSNLCINGSHIYCEEPQTRTARVDSNFSLASSGHGSMEDVPESSPPSVDSLRAVQYSPWTEEEEETADAENIKDVGGLEKEDKERRQKEEEEEMVRRQEEVERLAEEKRKERMRIEEEEKRQREEEEERAQEERRRQEEEHKLAEEKRRLEEEERRTEEEKVRKEEEERMRREEEERRRQEEELERLAEEKRREEQERKRIQEEMIRMEEERSQEERRRQEEEHKLAEEKRRLEEEERRINEENNRKEEEERIRREQERMQEEKRSQEEEERARRHEEERKLAEEKRRLEEEERRINEENNRKEEEERIRREQERMQEEKRRQEEEERARRHEEECKLAEEKRRLEEEERRIEEEERVRKEQERVQEERRRKEEEEMMKRQQEEHEEKRRLEEEERIRREREQEERKRIEAEEKIRKEEEERLRVEEERRRKEEEEASVRRQEEEREKLAEEKRIQEEQERRKIEEEEKKKREEEERIRKEEERRGEEEERARKEKEEYERLLEEKMRQEEEGRRRAEEEERIRQEEQTRSKMEEEKRRQEEEQRIREEEEKIKRKEEEERIRREKEDEEEARKMETRNAEEKRKSENKTKDKAAEVTSTNPFDENFSNNPFEENFNSPAEPEGSTTKVPTVKQRSPSAVSSLGRNTASTDEKDPVSTQREKRPAPQPPGRNQTQRQSEQEGNAHNLAQINKQSKDKDIKTVSVLPQRSVHVITPLSRSPTDANTQSVTQSSTTNVAKASKRPAPPRPQSVEEGPKTATSSDGKISKECGSEAKQEPTVYGLNPFEDNEDENELTAQDDTTNTGSVKWPPAVSQAADKDATSHAKIKSSKMAHAPPLPVKKAATSSTSNTEGAHVTDNAGVTVPDDSVTQPCDPEQVKKDQVQESQPPETTPSAGQEAEGRKEAPPAPSRRLQPVKPLNPLRQQSVSAERDKKSSEVQEKTKVTGPYSQLTQEELISLVLKQEKQLSERSSKISELEQYIDNLLVRVMEEQPSILMSMNSMKKSV